jgi:DNA-binding XRE family transcriptional regulator
MGIQVLLIEPDATLGNRLKELLRDEGFDVVWREDLQEGVIEYKKSRQPLVYMGVPASPQEAIQALRELKKTYEGSRVAEETPRVALKRIGMTIRQLRRSRDLTLREVGSRAGLSYSMISKVELGDCDPSMTTYLRIAKALDVELWKFFAPTSMS